MKRIILLFAIVLCGSVWAQTYDTVSGRNGILPNYYYPDGWYDTCIIFYETSNTPERLPDQPELWGSLWIFEDCGALTSPGVAEIPVHCRAYEHHIDGPVAITGVAVMMKKQLEESSDPDFLGVIYDTVYPDTVYILCRDTSGEVGVVASVSTQWDTAPCKVWKFPVNVDSAVYGFRYVYLYELKFDHPVVVDSLYYIYGTGNNLIMFNTEPYYWWPSHPYGHAVIGVRSYLQHYPGEPYTPCNQQHGNAYISRMDDKGKVIMYEAACDFSRDDWWGPYLLMIDSCTIEVVSADSTMGTAGPTRSMSKWVTQTITATPEYGYRFSHWNDGNTDNPRDIYLTQDTAFTAYFERNPRYMVQTRCVPEGKGLVWGDGQYWCGDTVTLTATGAIAPYFFYGWNDGNTDNPRRFVIGQDTSFTAYFARRIVGIDSTADAEALFTLTPNPTTGSVCCIIGEGASAGGVLTVADASGREVLRKELPPQTTSHTISLAEYPKGVYFVTLTTVLGSSTQKLVVER
ncbi:MAG: T9SS type A sorting domain-containing protein [Bacteroidales bacterium]|nr:T9SS type A sorting domain-containing protein [Bacteroidales bacterium]